MAVPLKTAPMSDVPPSTKQLGCLICEFVAANPRGLNTHRGSMHKVLMSTAGVRRMLKLPAAAAAVAATPSQSGSGYSERGGSHPPPPPPAPGDGLKAVDDAAAAGAPVPVAFDVAAAEGEMGQANAGTRCYVASSEMDATIAFSVAGSRATAPARPSRKRKTPGSVPVSTDPEFQYNNAAAHARGVYEDVSDTQRSSPLARLRQAAKAGHFNSHKLRVLQRFVLKTGRAGLTLQEKEELYVLLETWDGSRPGLSLDKHDTRTLREMFGSASALKQAIADDLDAAVVAAGWRKVNLTENGVSYRAYYRPVLDVVLALLDGQRVIKLWSGDSCPAPPSDRRESPMDGDAFRLCEARVCGRPGKNCVLGLHVYSDGSHVSWSGGKLAQFYRAWSGSEG